jgi:hypothetical protein
MIQSGNLPHAWRFLCTVAEISCVLTNVLPAETAETLSEEAKGVFRELPINWLVSRPKPSEVAPQLLGKVRELREKVEHFTNDASLESLTSKEIGQWSDAVERSFHFSVMLEWKSFAECRQILQQRWGILRTIKTPAGQEAAPPRLALKLADLAISSWIEAEPEAAADLIDETESTLQPRKTPGLKLAWEWSLPGYGNGLYQRAKRMLPEPRRTALLNRVNSKMTAYWSDETVPFDYRTRSICDYATSLYTENDVKGAASLMDAWAERHGEKATENFSWLFQRFFVAQIGEGDQAKGAQIFRQVEKLVAAGKIKPRDELFTVVSQSYYRYLPMPRLQHYRAAQIVMAEHAKQLARSEAMKP